MNKITVRTVAIGDQLAAMNAELQSIDAETKETTDPERKAWLVGRIAEIQNGIDNIQLEIARARAALNAERDDKTDE